MTTMTSMFTIESIDRCKEVFAFIESLPVDAKIEAINAIRIELHKLSPFSSEPVDCVLWVPASEVSANDYNPNSVAPPEMKLLAHSIMEDGYTQPIVAWSNQGKKEVVDGYHRNRVGREVKEVRERVHGYLPVAIINSSREDRGDRIAATIRHNRARGKHKIDAMSDIVVELKRRNWTDEKIAKNLGMDADEVLRLTQITGLAEMFADREFSQAWEADIASEIDEDESIETSQENPDEACSSPLREMGGLAGGDVQGNPDAPPGSSCERSGETSPDAVAPSSGDASCSEKVAGVGGSESKQSRKKSAGMARSVGVLFENGDSGLPYETSVAKPERKPAKPSKRRSRQGDS